MKKLLIAACCMLSACTVLPTEENSNTDTDAVGTIIELPAPPSGEIEMPVYCFLTSIQEDVHSLCPDGDDVWDYLAADTLQCAIEMEQKISSYTSRGIDYISPDGDVYMTSGTGHMPCGVHFSWQGRGVSDLRTLSLETLEENVDGAVVEARWYSSVEEMRADKPLTNSAEWARFFLRKENGRWVIWAVVDKRYVEMKH